MAALAFTSGLEYGFHQSLPSLSASGYSIVVTDRDYPQPSSVLKGSYPWGAVYAPNREHDLNFLGSSLKGKSVTWSVSKKTTSEEGDVSYETVRTWEGTASESQAILATVAGCEHMITAVDASGNSATTTFMSKHIRREVRTLSEDDRIMFLKTLATVMATPTKAGQELYGDDFLGGEW